MAGTVAGAYNVFPMDAKNLPDLGATDARKPDTLYEDAMSAAPAKVTVADFKLRGMETFSPFAPP